MDLLLTHGYFLSEDAKEQQIMKPYAPLGLLYLCSHLRAKGFAVEVFDSTFRTRAELLDILQHTSPSILGVYANLMTRKSAVEILRAAKECGWKTVAGGPEPAAYASEYLHAGADVVVSGEGEVTLEELVPALRSGDPSALSKVRGITYLQDGIPCSTSPRAQISDLDTQPWPARNAIDIAQYLRTWRTAHGVGSVSFITARGCPYHCRWCSHQVFGKTHRRRKPACVVDELQWIAETYTPEMAWIADDVFTIHHGWLRQYAAEMRRRSLAIPFECISRADRMNSEMVDLLAELGCFRVWIGSESGSQRLLDSMERGVTVQQVQAAVDLCKSRGIQSGMFLMWGYEGEELSDIEATIEHVKRTDPDIFLTTVSYPIKGTPYYDRLVPLIAQPKPWAESSDRDLRIGGRRSRRFYEFADKLLKDEVALSRLRRSGTNSEDENALTSRITSWRIHMHETATEVEE